MNIRLVPITILLILLVGACAPAPTPAPTPDVAPIYTAAAQTVIADISATAAAAASLTPLASPTSEPTQTPEGNPTFTATVVFGVTPGPIGTPLGLCNDSQWIEDVNIPDGTQMTPGQDFLKTWKIRNTGACTWGAGYKVVYGGYNDKMNGTPAALSVTVVPGQDAEVSVQFKAPTKVGEYLSAWRMADPNSYAFGQFFYVKIIVRQ
jgi:next-to-BRCA1 protein 1